MQQLTDFKQATRTTWATGDYDAMMRQEGLYEVGARIVHHLGIGPGDRVLDVACGTGNAAIPAAQAGAAVIGLDLTPELLDVARQRAAEAGVDVEWVEGDAEDLPYPGEEFDIVVSTFGVQFVPRQEVVADELARVMRPGARLGLVAWTPEGGIGEFFRTVSAHLPTPPAFVDPPLAWGQEDHVLELFEGTGMALEFSREHWEIGHASNAAAVDCYTTAFGPVVEARTLAEANGRWEQLRDELTALFERLNTAGESRVTFPAEYLLVDGTKQN